jgi:RNA polymerase sigma-70 factor (ECF subfamily)
MEKEFWHRFYGLTRKMPLMEREVFTLRYLDQLGIKEIAETLKKSESTVKTHLYRALKKFRRASELRALLKGNEA